MRVIVTGSRTWRDGALIRQKLEHCLTTAAAAGDKEFVLIHGACRAGADEYADGWGRWQEKRNTPIPVRVEPHHAGWEGPCRDQCQPRHRRTDEKRDITVCPAAGFYRNEDMVHAGADVVLAFIADQSKGATHCARYAETAGLWVQYFRVSTATDTLF